MRHGRVAAALALAAGLVVGGFWPTGAQAGDACGVCFRTASWYWENVGRMTGPDIYKWLGTCLDINDC